jgi:hypothetical protein
MGEVRQRMIKRLGFNHIHEAAKVEIRLNTKRAGAGNPQSGPFTSQVNLDLVLAITCRFDVGEYVSEIIIGNHKGRRLAVPQQAQEAWDTFELEKIDFSKSEEGVPSCVHLRIAQIHSGASGHFKERIAVGQLSQATPARFKVSKKCPGDWRCHEATP